MEEKDDTSSFTPSKLKEWLIVSFVTSVLASTPTIWKELKAWRLGVRLSQLQVVEEQTRIWERNLDCLSKQGMYEADGPDGLIVKVSLCETGDVLLRYYQNDWVPQFKWVEKPYIVK